MIVLGNYYNFTHEDLITCKNMYGISCAQKATDEYIETITEQKDTDTIIINTSSNIANKIIKKIEVVNNNIKYIYIQDFLEKYLKKYYIDYSLTLDETTDIKPYSKFEYLIKRIMDFLISIPLLIITLPIFIYSAYKIKKESPDGSILFKQTRVGQDGKEFICYKFRSMRTDVDYYNKYTEEDDPRIFPWGKFMRKCRIDELPQLWNVLKGDMHLIGPRAEWNKLVKEYEQKIPHYNLRHTVKPGITGWAQVMYHYGSNIEDTKQKLMYDLYYIKNWSLWLEIKTIFKTILVVIGKKGM